MRAASSRMRSRNISDRLYVFVQHLRRLLQAWRKKRENSLAKHGEEWLRTQSAGQNNQLRMCTTFLLLFRFIFFKKEI